MKALLAVLCCCALVATAARPLRLVDAEGYDDSAAACVHDCVQMCNAVGVDGVLPGPAPAKLTIVCYLDGPVRSCTIV